MPERYDAVVIEESETRTNDDGTPQKFYTNVGAGFPHKNGGGMTVLIRPGLSVHGELVLYPARERNTESAAKNSTRRRTSRAKSS